MTYRWRGQVRLWLALSIALAGVISPCAFPQSIPDQNDSSSLLLQVDDLRAELGAFPHASDASGETWLHGGLRLSTLSGPWELVLGARFDALRQSGGNDFTSERLDYGENFLRWRNEENRFTLGIQNVLWGRVHEIPPVDHLSRVDISRFILDPLAERRRPVPALRLEHYREDLNIDTVWTPTFTPALLPDAKSVWYPLDTTHGRILSIGDIPVIVEPQVRDRDPGGGGGGIRVTRTGGDVDYGVSLQYARQSLPYYRASFGFLDAVYPYSWVIGGELETHWRSVTWRMETAWSSDVPVTTRQWLRYRTDPAVDWVLGAEFYPGDGETRVNLQLSGHRNLVDQPVLDRVKTYSLNGEIQRDFAHGRWRANLRFIAGLNERECYLNPRLSYLGFSPHTLYLTAHIFSGAPQTPSGYNKDNDLIAAGWQIQF